MASKAEAMTDFIPVSAEDVVNRNRMTPNPISRRGSIRKSSLAVAPMNGHAELIESRRLTPEALAKPPEMKDIVPKLLQLPDLSENFLRLAKIGSFDGSVAMPADGEKTVNPEVAAVLQSTPSSRKGSGADNEIGWPTNLNASVGARVAVVDAASDAYDHTPRSLYRRSHAHRRVTTATSCDMDADPDALMAAVRILPTPADQTEYVENKYLMQWYGVDNRRSTPRVCTHFASDMTY